MSAEFWNNPNAKDDTPVVRHAYDVNGYSYPDSRMLERMPMGRVGQFAVVPAANRDGTSKGFDVDAPGVVHVDPDAPDGGAVVDYGRVNEHQFNSALATSQYPHQVYYQLGMPPSRVKVGYDHMDQRPTTNPHIPPGGYVTPGAALGGGQLPQMAHAQELLPITQVMPMQTQPLPPTTAPLVSTAVPAPQPGQFPAQAAPPQQYQQPQYPQQQPPQYQQPQQYTPPQYQPPQYPQYPQPQYAPPAQDATLQAIAQLTQVVQGLTNDVAQMRSRPMPPSPQLGGPPRLNTVPSTMPLPDGYGPTTATPPRRRPVREDADDTQETAALAPEPMQERPMSLQRQTLRDIEPEPTNDGVITGFETLEIPFLQGPKPEKAKQRVIFEYPATGRNSAVYHGIFESETCLVLVYDTRYEDGTQYVPPDHGEVPIKLHVFQPGNKKAKEHLVTSMNLTYSVGVLDFIVLIKTTEEAVPQDQDFEQP